MTDRGRNYVLPRPDSSTSPTTITTIAAPPESTFTSTFGALLPPATFLTSPFGKTAYYDFPPSSRTSSPSRVLLIHGVCTPALGLLPLIRALRSSNPHTHFITYDLWGHGLSDTPRVPHTPSLFQEQVRAVLTHAGWSSAHVVGFSFGGATAAGFTANFPEFVTSLVLIAPAGMLREEGFSEEQLALVHGRDNVDEAAARDFILDYLEGGELVLPSGWKDRVAKGEVVYEAVRKWERDEHDGHIASVVGIFRDGGVLGTKANFVKAAKNVKGVMAILGELDDLCMEGDLRDVGISNVHVIPGVGHGVVRERVPEVVKLLDAFWAGLA